ncbi:Crp/Fnr family transcriptional regulator [Streptomyces sp. H10-C2]|uniref:Crp/Fnr family transcriptional regulator n=1 Tax=unclassified Streptomyces TaxID=2593676 RepID=UPI0024BA7110|nr:MULTISPECIES: Crp/Fnr family transcriptional regulator [unclassified Streptomyces]MDJ0345382.1 Crp/Fnr family transcriptional regulator [Streptomyces sp. PH10-H1]MDJ0372136.1 Crp/Fnr family transcriptional regulator [Streptomyces sp. H10-C2]
MPYCLAEGADALAGPAWGAAPPPWAPGRRETPAAAERDARVSDAGAGPDDRTWCIAEVDIFCDLSEPEMDVIAAAAPMKTYTAGEILYSPHQPSETLFMLKRGRIRIFRVSADGRALTTAIVSPGTIFGEMVLLGQRMYDNFAEALDEVIVCVMSRTDVRRHLLADARIATRITEILGRRLTEIEQRLSDSVFKNVPQRIATTLTTLAAEGRPRPLSPRKPQIALTHQQIAALAGTSRETTTKVLRDLADRGLLRLARGRITVLDPERLKDEAG